MECKKCGTIHENAFCPSCGTPSKANKAKKPIFKKWWFWLIAVIVVIVIASSAGGGDDTTTDANQNNAPTSSGSANNATENQQQAASNEYKAGDIINANGLKITYVSAEKWDEPNMYLQPEDGYMYIRLKISAENTSSVDRYISSFEFECYADGKKVSAAYVGDNTLEGGNLSSGRQTEGYIYFSVPVNAKEIEVEYETSFWTDKKAILIVDLAK